MNQHQHVDIVLGAIENSAPPFVMAHTPFRNGDRKFLPQRTTTRYQGFTIIELLVVITLITFLFSLLLPTLRSARDAAATAKCAINQRSLANATFNYATDNKDYLPTRDGLGQQPGSADYSPFWGYVLIPYANEYLFAGVSNSETMASAAVTRNLAMCCPIYDNTAYSSGWPGAPAPTVNRSSYWYNTQVDMNISLETYEFTDSVTSARVSRQITMSSIHKPSPCVLFGPLSYATALSYSSLYYNPRHSCAVGNYAGTSWAHYYPTGVGASAMTVRTDGHVERIPFKPANLITPYAMTAEDNAIWYGQ